MPVDKNEFFHEDGRMKSSAERAEYRNAKKRAADLARIAAGDAAAKSAKPRSPYESQRDLLKSKLPHVTPGERESIKRRLAMLNDGHAKWEQQQVVEKFESDFDKSSLARLAAESFERIERSGKAIYPNATDDQLNNLLALHGARHQFPTPDDFGREFFNQLTTLEEQEAVAAKKSATDSQIESERLAAESARQQVRAVEAQQRLNQTKGIIDE